MFCSSSLVYVYLSEILVLFSTQKKILFFFLEYTKQCIIMHPKEKARQVVGLVVQPPKLVQESDLAQACFRL